MQLDHKNNYRNCRVVEISQESILEKKISYKPIIYGSPKKNSSKLHQKKRRSDTPKWEHLSIKFKSDTTLRKVRLSQWRGL
jgi:hypothetical protein